MDIDRRGIKMPLDPHHVENCIWKKFFPSVARSHVIHVVEHALLDQIEELLRCIELCRRWRVTTHDAVDGHRSGLFPHSDGRIDPHPSGSGIGL